MTVFESICKELGVYPNTIAEQILVEMCNELIFDDKPHSDEEIAKIVIKRFKKEYKD
ncbi:MAG: hypothetical protein IKT32_00760 [Clostridia bacterium]|nr:hypothetical protein [Clostridia bacterium]